MADFFFRTEDIKPEDVESYFVETLRDREIINALKARNPVVLSGSRGVGKSFLLRVAESELNKDFDSERVLAAYVSFNRSSLINTTDRQQFQHWMLARICARITRILHAKGLLNASAKSASILLGGSNLIDDSETEIEKLAKSYEESWKVNCPVIDNSALPSLDDFRDAIEDTCESANITRMVVLIDEAAHILIPEQQRQFFTLFRDLRSPYLACKAAVYPGVTSYGETFQPSHDATMLSFDRDILGSDYVETMRDIVVKQAESGMLEDIARNESNFSLLAYASTGNPRVLLKTLARAPKLNSTQTNEVLRGYYRNDLWSEHSTLPEKYSGHKHLIDWGRKFIEGIVLPDLKRKNDLFLEKEQKSTCFFWIHRDAPQPVKEALKLLAYSGIVSEHAVGIKATRGEIGTRYAVNLGALLSLESLPTSTGLNVARGLFPARMSEFGANHPAYQSLLSDVPSFTEPGTAAVLQQQLNQPVDVLDVTDWQLEKLRELGLKSVGDVLDASESQLQKMMYVGEKRSRRIRNAALAAVFEYLSG